MQPPSPREWIIREQTGNVGWAIGVLELIEDFVILQGESRQEAPSENTPPSVLRRCYPTLDTAS